MFVYFFCFYCGEAEIKDTDTGIDTDFLKSSWRDTIVLQATQGLESTGVGAYNNVCHQSYEVKIIF